MSKNLRHLRRSRTPRLTQEKLANALGLVASTYGSYEEGRAEPKLETLFRIARYFNVNLQALLTEDLSQRSPSETWHPYTDDRPIEDEQTESSPGLAVCRLSRFGAIAGPKRVLDAQDYLLGMSAIEVGLLGIRPGVELRVFRVEGDSMWPIPNGALVFGAHLSSVEEVINGRPYLIITRTEGIIFKILYHEGAPEGMLLTAATNPRYAPYAIKLSDVIEIWAYAGHFCYDESLRGGSE